MGASDDGPFQTWPARCSGMRSPRGGGEPLDLLGDGQRAEHPHLVDRHGDPPEWMMSQLGDRGVYKPEPRSDAPGRYFGAGRLISAPLPPSWYCGSWPFHFWRYCCWIKTGERDCATRALYSASAAPRIRNACACPSALAFSASPLPRSLATMEAASCWACSTSYFFCWASCCALCLRSTAFSKSGSNRMSLMETSRTTMPYFESQLVIPSCTSALIFARC